MDTHTMSLHRQRQSSAPSSSLNNSGQPKAGQYSPQRFDGSKDSTSTQARYSGTSPTRSGAYGPGSSPFGGQQPLTTAGGGYDTVQASSAVEGDLVVALRGMAVEDDYGLNQQVSGFRQPLAGAQISGYAGHQSQPPALQGRNLSATQHPRAPFTAFPQPDFSGYYSGPSRVDFPFAYDPYRTTTDASLYAASPALSAATTTGGYSNMGPTTLHPHMSADVHHGQQSNMFYDYSASGRQGSYYYPTQPMMYHSHPAMPTAPVPSAHPDKKQYKFNLQQNQQLAQQNLMYANLRSTPSPHPQGFHTVDYAAAAQMQLMLPGALYGHANGMNIPGMHMFHRGRRNMQDLNAVNRSALLDEFRSNKTRGWELRDIFGHIVEFSGDQHGSRFIQQKLESASVEERQAVFDEIVPQHALQLVEHVFGNYVIQKLFEYGTGAQRGQLASAMEGHILEFALHMYGCRVVQKAVEFITPEQQGSFVKELDVRVLECVMDANGNHVVQRLIELVPAERLAFIAAFRGNVSKLASHSYGCRVLQRCLEHLPDEQTRPLLDELHQNVLRLMVDQFGNYVIQFILEKGQPQDRAQITSRLRGEMLQMSRHKYASNVCEKALVTAEPGMRQTLINELLSPRKDGVDVVVTMMKDQFGNYVLQRALSVSEGDQKEALIKKIRPQLLVLRRQGSTYGKHLIAIERLLEKCATSGAIEQHTPHENAGVLPADTSSKSQ